CSTDCGTNFRFGLDSW
nr:immunoglobulin heavy chain junction region [Macaca mulatta]MOV48986.1 immunoglobulin heavy chain junction region [Macaca mulatta]MOV49684.1 immunoglobulin heavy chain junction region [Macaca mulatta]MOV50590.1 immunoglobulin heavy chain junction region [Macaca mulatta]MOV52331.1 immunoglobulin heavy chain junction region [Macaca mulatta]